MKKRYLHKLSILLIGLYCSCSEDVIIENLTPEQQNLIGRAVNFNTSIADAFVTRASSYTDILDGGFNQNDRMRIYRNYYGDNGAWETVEAYRTYRYLYKADATTGIDLGKDWRPEAGRQGYDNSDGSDYKTFTQTENDSLTWENGKTVRFRAWSQSNYHNVLNGVSKTYYYPDFCAADYVVASGPSQSIPMVLKHLGTRFRFQVLQSGNEFDDIRFCSYIKPDGTTNSDGWKDYKYADNADTNKNDGAETEAGKTDEQAMAECEAVTAIFRRMCMPAGVDITNGTLMAIQNDWWKSESTTNEDIKFLEDRAGDNFIKYNTLSPQDIATKAKRPFFSNINGYPLMVTIPYDISTNIVEQGELLTLPACTRFRVYIRDINGGDGYNTSGYEGKYHIFALSDVKKVVKDAENNDVEVAAFPEGLKLEPGVSYTFKVGYRYGGLYVVVNNDLSWVNQDIAEAEGKDEVVTPTPSTTPYKWWQDAIHDAIPTGTEDFRPVFHIKNETEFLEFINLVNGTATTKTDGLYLLDHTTIVDGKPVTKKDWSTVNSIYKPNWVTEEEMAEQGYIFYDHYYAANADKAAYSQRDYLKGPYPFYDDNLRRNFEIKLDTCLDMKDWALESIGRVAAPFMGNFDGQGHTIKNLYMTDENLFGYVNGNGTEHASITNLKIESLHNTCLIGTGINQIYIVGVSLHAPSTTNSIAHSMSMASGVSGTSLVVGCIHVGDAGGALVGTASNLNMFGCMQAAQGLTSSSGALIGTDANSSEVFKPQISLSGQKAGTNVNAKPSFRDFIGNYYDKELSPSAKAVGSTDDDYSLREYIRGSSTDILRAKNDFLTTEVTMKQLLAQSNYQYYYGLAPWHVMNYAIYWYNKNRVTTQINHPCTVHYENNTVGYAHQYPVLKDKAPEDATVYGEGTVSGWNPVNQSN